MFWRGVWGYLPLNVLQAVVAFGTIFAFTRLLSPEQFGAFAVAFGIANLAQTAGMTWIEAAMARFWAAADERGETARHMATTYVMFAVVSAVFVLAAAVLMFAPFEQEMRWALAAGVAAGGPRSLVILARERRRAAGEVMGASGLDAAYTAGGFAVGLALAAVGVGAASPLLGAGLAALMCAVFVTPGELRIAKGGRFEADRAKAYARYGVPVAVSLMLSIALSTTDRVILAWLDGPASAGVYQAGYSLANRTLDLMFVWLGMAGWPALVSALERGGHDALREAAREQARLMALIALPAAAGLALVAQPLAEVLVGEEFRAGAARVTPWIALSGLLAGATVHYLHHAFTLGKRTVLFAVAMSVPVVANALLCLALVPRFGLNGAVWASAASFVVGAIASRVMGRNIVPLPIPWIDIAKAVLACAVMAVAVRATPAWGGLPELILKAGVGALTYGAAAWLLDASGVRSQSARAVGALRARFAS